MQCSHGISQISDKHKYTQSGQNKLSSMSFFLQRHNFKLLTFNCLFKKFQKGLKTLTKCKLDNILSIIAQRLTFDMCFIIRECPDF